MKQTKSHVICKNKNSKTKSVEQMANIHMSSLEVLLLCDV